MQLKNIFKINFHKIGASLFHLWFDYFRWFFFAAFFGALAFVVIFWRNSLYDSGWSEEQKKAFIFSQQRQNKFKEDEFRQVVSITEEKQKIYEGESLPVKDIFSPKP